MVLQRPSMGSQQVLSIRKLSHSSFYFLSSHWNTWHFELWPGSWTFLHWVTVCSHVELLQMVDGVFSLQQFVGELHDLLVHRLLVPLHLPQLWAGQRQSISVPAISHSKAANQEPEATAGGPSAETYIQIMWEKTESHIFPCGQHVCSFPCSSASPVSFSN